MKRSIYIGWIVVFVFTHVGGRATEDSFSRLTVENGLSNNEVNTIYKDSSGFMWFGTLYGIDRFDGLEIRSYADYFPDPVINVFSIIEDTRGSLWVGTSTGLYRYVPANNFFERVLLEKDNLAIRDMVVAADSLLCLGTDRGLFKLNVATGEALRVPPVADAPLGAESVTGLFIDNHDNLWLATNFGLTRVSLLNGASVHFVYNVPDKEEFNTFTSLCHVGNKIYLGTASRGIVEFDLVSKSFAKGPDVGNKLIRTIDCDNSGQLFIGTNGGGLKIYDIRSEEIKSIEKRENDPLSLSSNSIYSFWLDENNRYWIGTYSGGVNYSDRISGNFSLHRLSVQYPEVNQSIRSFWFSPKGDEFIGTRNGFVYLNSQGEAKVFKAGETAAGLRSNIILTVFPWKEDVLIGTYGGGISRFSLAEQRVMPFLQDGIFEQGSNYAFDRDGEAGLWIASFNGLYRLDDISGKLSHFTAAGSGLVNDQLFEVTVDSKNRLWAGTMSGACALQYDGNSLKAINLPEVLDMDFKINYIYEDQAGNIWICTEAGGLYMTDGNLQTGRRITQQNGLPDNSVCAIIESSSGVYWISTLKGLCKYTMSDDKCVNFSVSDGLPGLVFSPAAAHQAEDGRLWFGNENGLTGFYPGEMDQNRVQSDMVITNLYIFGQNIMPGESDILKMPIENTDEIVLRTRSGNIGFRFVDLNFLNPYDNNYFYMLEGYDRDWRNNGNNNTVHYNDIRPGRYIFRVWNAVSASEGRTNMTHLRVVVKRPYKSTAVFWLLTALPLGFAGFFLLRFILNLTGIKKKYIREHQVPEKYKGSGLTRTELDEIIQKLKDYTKRKKPYLNAELKLSDVSRELDIPSHHISQALNQVLNQSFSDFNNKCRVREVRYMLENEAHQHLTLIAVAKQCGFNSKTSFYRVFKKFTGKTPADYLNSLKTDSPG